MTNPVIIVDPVSAGVDLAPAFSARGVSCVAVRSTGLTHTTDLRNRDALRPADFLAVYQEHDGLLTELRELRPRAVIAGSEWGVALADQLASALTPESANVPELAPARRHKAAMQQALAEAGLPSIRTLHTASAAEAAAWLADQNLVGSALVIKPPASAGSENVHHIAPGGDWRRVFDHVLGHENGLLGTPNETVLVQERVFGVEYAVGTVSAAGKHSYAHLMRYNKTSAGDRETVFDHNEFLAIDRCEFDELRSYTEAALDALGIRWGAAHNEVMLTPDGPRLIETGARMIGGPVVGFARAATGGSQLERVVEAYIDGTVGASSFELRQTVMPVFLISPATGVLRNAEVFDEVSNLSTHLSTHVFKGNGDLVPRTVDYDTALGIIALAGPREAVFADYAKVRAVEKLLILE
ncbi:MAG: ATP-grasp domain-containing protein [Kutzneria sp.]|nr:ATP-grasp domain-containing protein [Kutzneria sp.]